MTTTHTDQAMDTYLSALRSKLGPMTVAERDDILREIGAHIRDAVESGTPLEDVVARLGAPAQLAAEYRSGLLIQRASQSVSPLLLLQATFRLASQGVAGVAVFLFGLAGYGMGISLFLMGLLKPFQPQSTGMWVMKSTNVVPSNGQISLGIRSIRLDASSHEVLGWWAIPVGLISGAVILIVTTMVIRLFVRSARLWQRRLAGSE